MRENRDFQTWSAQKLVGVHPDLAFESFQTPHSIFTVIKSSVTTSEIVCVHLRLLLVVSMQDAMSAVATSARQTLGTVTVSASPNVD